MRSFGGSLCSLCPGTCAVQCGGGFNGVQTVHAGKVVHGFAAGFKGLQQCLVTGHAGGQLGHRIVQDGVGRVVLVAHAQGVVGRGHARAFCCQQHAVVQLGAHVFTRAGMAAFEHLQQRMVLVLGCHGFHRVARQVMPGLARRHGREVAGGACVQRQCFFQAVFGQYLGLGRQQVLQDAALERQRLGTKQGGVQRGQLCQHRVLGRGRAACTVASGLAPLWLAVGGPACAAASALAARATVLARWAVAVVGGCRAGW